MKSYETFEHGADVGIRGIGDTLEEALSESLKALASLLVEDTSFLEERPKLSYPLHLEAEFLDELFVQFINRVLSLSYSENVLLYEFEGKIENIEGSYHLKGVVKGIPFDFERYGYGVEVKGATFTMAKIEKSNSHYIAQCVVDV